MKLRKIGYYKDIYLSILILHSIYLSKIWKLSLKVVSIVIIQEGVFISPQKQRYLFLKWILRHSIKGIPKDLFHFITKLRIWLKYVTNHLNFNFFFKQDLFKQRMMCLNFQRDISNVTSDPRIYLYPNIRITFSF